MRRTAWVVAGLFAGLMIVAGVGRAQDKSFDKLPKPVRDAVKAKYPKAEILKAAEEKADGKTSYEVYMKLNGKGLDVTFSPTGAVEVVEKEIDGKDLPKNILAVVEKKHPNPTWAKVEEISKPQNGKMVVDVYEILFTTPAKKTIEMTIAPDGKVTGEADKTPAKKDDAKGKGK